MGEKALTLFPEDGVPWGLWCKNPPFPGFIEGYFPTPQSFQLSQALTTKLEAWMTDWRSNYVFDLLNQELTWTLGFDRHNWVNTGSDIATAIEKETGYLVDRQFLSYLLRPVPLIPRFSEQQERQNDTVFYK